jgi:branched-chain amino acid aminotransferase
MIRTTRANPSRLTPDVRENAPFGAVFSDHMLVATCTDGRWCEPEILPYGPLPLPPAPSAVHYGQAIFEGFKAHRTADGNIALFRPRDNLARLNRSATRLVMPEVPQRMFLDGLAALVGLDREWVPYREGGALYVRPVYFAIDEELFVRPASKYRLVLLTCPVGPYFAGAVSLVAEERYVRAFQGGTGNIKSAGNYAGSLLAARDAQDQGFHTVLWLDGIDRRFAEECGVMNIMFVIGGTVVTPPLGGTILPGVTRDSVLTLLRDAGVPVEERAVSIDELLAAHEAGKLAEAVGIGTAATVASISRIRYRERQIELPPARPDTVMQNARARLEAIRTGREPDPHGWLMTI